MSNTDWVKVKIFRYDPSRDKKPRYEAYKVPFFDGMRVLDTILYVTDYLGKDISFRWSCGSGRCGTCAVMVNGEPKLACWEPAEREMIIEPLPYFPILKDLVIDRSSYDRSVLEMKPFLQRAVPLDKFPEDLKHDDNIAIIDKLGECIHCLSCLSACPILRKAPLWVGPSGLVALAKYSTHPGDKGDKPRIAYSEGEIYNCTVCNRCKEVCPKEIAVPDIAIERVRALCVERGCISPTIGNALEGVYKYGNPWGLSPTKRSDWAEDLKVKYVSEDESTELLYFVGCAASYDPRAQKTARAMVYSLNTLGIDFSILGNEEICCGNEVSLLGEKGLFEELTVKNLAIFDRYDVKNIVTTSPHCFNAFSNRYKRKLQVKHYTQYFGDLIDSRKLNFLSEIRKVVTYQDPCFLGRHNNLYDDPRKIINSIPGVRFVELSESRERSVCCEGGGGRMWYDVQGESLSEARVREAVDLGANKLAVACPFCLLTLDDAVKTTNNEGIIQVVDILELLAQALTKHHYSSET